MKEETAEEASSAGVGPAGAHSRGKWANNWEFLLSMTGTLISIETFLRFPFVLFKNGGAAFLIPYCMLLLLFGFPLFFLETALGQYTSEGAITAWRKICPMFTGLGVATQVCVFYMNTYFIVILAWTVFYLVVSSWSPLPWTTCYNWWNTQPCHDGFDDLNATFANDVDSYFNESEIMNRRLPGEDYFLTRVLRVSEDGSLGSVNWELALCLLLVWVICYFCVWKGHRSIAKVMYFLATFPFLLLLIIFFRVVTLPGAAHGLFFCFYPDLRRLAHFRVWVDAAYCVIFSLGSCSGVLTTLGSYNKYNSNCFRGCLVICGLKLATNLFVACIVFSVFGFLAETYGTDLSEQASSGVGLAFMFFPTALSKMPDSNFWAVLFFLMIFLLGLGTQFMFTETLATAIIDLFPRHLRRPKARELLVLVISVVCFLFGIMFVTEGGPIAFIVVDYCFIVTVVFIAALECIIIGWVYGADRFYHNLEDMLGYPVIPLFKYCWMFVSPFICGLLLTAFMTERHAMYFAQYEVGRLGHGMAGILVAVPLLCIPVFVLVALCKDGQNMLSSSRDLRQAQPHKPVLTLCKCAVYWAPAAPTKPADHPDEKMMMEEAGGGV